MDFFVRHKLTVATVAAAAAFGLLIHIFLKDDASDFVAYVLEKNTHPLGFLALFLLLPMLGFPIIPFLVLLGVKFSIPYGILVLYGGAAVHLVVAFWVTRSFLRPHILKYAAEHHLSLPELPKKRILYFSFLFMAVPGLSYAMKNYLLPLSGISFRHHVGIGCVTQATLGIPFIVAGHAAAGKSFLLLAVVLLLVSSIYGLGFWFRGRKSRYLHTNRRS